MTKNAAERVRKVVGSRRVIVAVCEDIQSRVYGTKGSRVLAFPGFSSKRQPEFASISVFASARCLQGFLYLV